MSCAHGSSGSSNGSLAKVDIESGSGSVFSKGNSGVRSICTLSGGSLLVSGHSAGQVLMWDCRSKSSKPCNVFVPSKRRLDAVTTLANHPTQSSILLFATVIIFVSLCCKLQVSFGTDLGTVGFCDVRGVSHDLITRLPLFKRQIQVGFHPECGDHFVCASADGKVLVKIFCSSNVLTASAVFSNSLRIAEG
ncbi:unnamed protein product [Heligmosomoides polygyrus]|uniref:WD_REPEATS_REGION domain-containing protein n=1 Tax=Heligmosomoides polygyrus TaxID=6339 RepID=A0A183GV53_HELPZ|nr:unnamed protein product [Heligmosomoides polygyrus]